MTPKKFILVITMYTMCSPFVSSLFTAIHSVATTLAFLYPCTVKLGVL